MIEDFADVPPALTMIAAELRLATSISDMRRRLRAMLRDVRDQSEVFQSESLKRASDSRPSGRFEIHLHGGLDLLSGIGCGDIRCRIQTAERISRSVGLIADRVWLTDHLSERFLDFGRPTNNKLDTVIADIAVLARILPLINEGVIRFRCPIVAACAACLNSFEEQVTVGARKLAKDFSDEFYIEKTKDKGFCAHSGSCFEPEMVYYGDGSTRPPRRSALALDFASQQLRSALWQAREASMTGGAIFSNSRLALAGLLQQDNRQVDSKTLFLLDQERALNVPWVSDLSASQIVQLRQEASSAMPVFREKMYRAMSVVDAKVGATPATVVAELREQAADVRAELEAKKKSSARYWKVSYGLLGLGLSAYGVAADQVIPGVGGLLPIVQLLINHKTGFENDVAKLTTKPGFVLVKARDILAHSHAQ